MHTLEDAPLHEWMEIPFFWFSNSSSKSSGEEMSTGVHWCPLVSLDIANFISFILKNGKKNSLKITIFWVIWLIELFVFQ